MSQVFKLKSDGPHFYFTALDFSRKFKSTDEHK